MNFNEVIYAKRTKKGKCSKCNKKCQETEKFYQTINPWNKKTPEQILEEEKQRCNEWEKIPPICNDCKYKSIF